jgi:hypothetical protein
VDTASRPADVTREQPRVAAFENGTRIFVKGDQRLYAAI